MDVLQLCHLIRKRAIAPGAAPGQGRPTALAELPIAPEVGPLLAEEAIRRGVLTSEMIEFLPQARSGEAWSNPDWMAEYRRLAPLARAAGFDEQDGWVWGLWQWA